MRNYTTYTSLTKALPQNGLFDADYLSILSIHGDRAKEFLQGQLSCDVNNVTETRMQQGILCQIDGRIIALVDVIEWHGIHLIMPDDLLPIVESTLSKVARLSRVSLEKNMRWRVFGHYGESNEDIPCNLLPPKEKYAMHATETACMYALDATSHLLLIDAEAAEKYAESFSKQQRYHGSMAWHALQLRQGRIEIYPESSGLFLPHRLGLHKTGHISFNKGCYKGQEIIARMQYRGTMKHALQLSEGTYHENLPLGLSWHNGELVDYARLDEQHCLFAMIVKTDISG